MAKRRITVSLHGRVIGTRQTDRLYTHAVILTDYNPDAARQRAASNAASNARHDAANWAHARLMIDTPTGETPKETQLYRGRHELAWRWPIKQEDKDRALRCIDGCETLEQYLAHCAARRAERTAESIAKSQAKGDHVLSFHASLALATKARDAARANHPEYMLQIQPVDAEAATETA